MGLLKFAIFAVVIRLPKLRGVTYIYIDICNSYVVG